MRGGRVGRTRRTPGARVATRNGARSAGRRATKTIVEQRLTSAGGHDGAHELEILEQGAAVVPAGGDQYGAAHRDRSRPVAPCDAIQEHAAGVPAGMPRQRIEVVLRTNDLGEVERCRNAIERRLVITHVVVCDNHARVRRQPQPGEHAANFAHLGRELRGTARRDAGRRGERPPRLRRAPRRSRQAIRQRRWSLRVRSASADTPPDRRAVQAPPTGSA